MSPTLKKQLSFLSVLAITGGVFQWVTTSTRAQDSGYSLRMLLTEEQRVLLSRDEAARNFGTLLEFFDPATNRRGARPVDPILASSVSPSSNTIRVRDILLLLAAQWKQPYQVTDMPSSDDTSATITIEKTPRTTPRPLVLVKEGEVWGVDVAETYARWNHLDAAAKAKFLATVGESTRRQDCQSNLKQIGLAMMMYSQDYDEVLPPAKTWTDAISPYVKSRDLFNCPAVKQFGYAFNWKLSNKPLLGLTHPTEKVAIYETTVLKNNAVGQGENTAYRHDGGENVLFVDGHVRWTKAGAPLSFKLKP